MAEVGIGGPIETQDHPVALEDLDPAACIVLVKLPVRALRRLAIVRAFDEVQRGRTAPAIEEQKLVGSHRMPSCAADRA